MTRLLILFCFTLALMAQQPAQVTGLVRDSSDLLVPGAQVTLVHQETGLRRNVRTNDEGGYAVSSLPAGPYKITARKEGFQTVARLGVILALGQSARVDFSLRVGSMQDTITVEGAASLVNLEDGTVGVTVPRGWAERLPLNGRGINGLLDLAAGVTATPATQGEAGQFSVNGLRPNTNYFLVDGVSVNSGVAGAGLPGQFSGGALPGMTAIGSLHGLASLEEIAELRVQTSTFSPEFGRMPGAQVAISTQAGTNNWHGSAFYGFRHEQLAANDWFANRSGVDRGVQRLQNFGGSLGGPVRRNQTFVFGALESLHLRQPYLWRITVPSQRARDAAVGNGAQILNAFPSPNGRDLGEGQSEFTANTSPRARLWAPSLRIDHSFSPRWLTFVRYQDTPSSQRTGLIQTNQLDFRTHHVTVGLTTILTPSVLNEARVHWSRAEVRSRWEPGAGGSIDLSKLLQRPPVSGDIVYGVSIGGIGTLVTGQAGESRQGQWYWQDTLSLTRNGHQLRAGIEYQRLTPHRDRPLTSVSASFASVFDAVSGRPPNVTFTQASAGASVLETFSLFVQDTWQITPRLHLTYGTRWEYTPSPAIRGAAFDLSGSMGSGTPPVTGGTSNGGFFPQSGPTLPTEVTDSVESPTWPARYNQFAPRVGAAYQLTPDGSFVLRAGTGLFYDLGFSSATDPINGSPFNSWRTLLASIGPALGDTASYLSYRFAKNLRTPSTLEWNVALEKAWKRSDVLTASYVGSAGHNLLRREGYLLPSAQLPQVIVATNNGESSYHSLQLQYRRRLRQGLQGSAAYVWSHSIDNGSWDSALFLVRSGIVEQDRGSSNFDIRHNFTAGLSYSPRWSYGWTISSTVRARTGFPVSVLNSDNSFGLGFDNAIRPDLVPGVPVWLNDANAPGGRRLNPRAFTLPAGLQGNLGRNAISGFGLAQADLAVDRDFRLRNESILQVRIEAYNVTNHPNFADPVRYLSSALFGESTSMLNLMLGTGTPRSGLTPAFQSGGPRTVQFTVRYRF